MRPAAQARDILSTQFHALFPDKSLPWAALRILLAQSRQEGEWGAFGGYDRDGNYWDENWGGVQAKGSPPCAPGTFAAKDSRPTSKGQVYFPQCFQGYLTEADGARDFLRHALILRPDALAPLLAGDVWGYADKLHRGRYFGGFSTTIGEGPEKDAMREWEQIGSYVDMLDNQGAEVDQALGMPPTPRTKKPPPGRSVNGPSIKKASRPLGWVVTIATLGLPLILRK